MSRPGFHYPRFPENRRPVYAAVKAIEEALMFCTEKLEDEDVQVEYFSDSVHLAYVDAQSNL